jgi:hypothetical protein
MIYVLGDNAPFVLAVGFNPTEIEPDFQPVKIGKPTYDATGFWFDGDPDADFEHCLFESHISGSSDFVVFYPAKEAPGMAVEVVRSVEQLRKAME